MGPSRFVLADRFEVDEALGAGGMAFVFGGTHRALGKPVAIKILRPTRQGSAHARFLREARIASRLNHPNLVQVLDFGNDEAQGLTFLVMERLAGPTIAQELDASGVMPVERSLAVLRQLADALACVHRAGVVHRDVGPRNVMLEPGPSGQVVAKLCDFGLCWEVEGDVNVTGSAEIMGTPGFMAPEQIVGAAVGPYTDVYAFGATAYEMLSGALPFAADTLVALFASKLHRAPMPLRERAFPIVIPPALDAIVMRCLETDPKRRYPDAEALCRAFDQVELDPSLTASDTGFWPVSIADTFVEPQGRTPLPGAPWRDRWTSSLMARLRLYRRTAAGFALAGALVGVLATMLLTEPPSLAARSRKQLEPSAATEPPPIEEQTTPHPTDAPIQGATSSTSENPPPALAGPLRDSREHSPGRRARPTPEPVRPAARTRANKRVPLRSDPARSDRPAPTLSVVREDVPSDVVREPRAAPSSRRPPASSGPIIADPFL
ncbi:MAG: protein kinase [Myxococcota bacterium]